MAERDPFAVCSNLLGVCRKDRARGAHWEEERQQLPAITQEIPSW